MTTQTGQNASGAELQNFEPISYTARKILEKRALHTAIPMAKELADAAGVEWRVSRIREWARRLIWGELRAGGYLQFRHDAISHALESFPGSAVLEIGAGLGTRGLIEAGDREAYIETDLPELIQWKRQLAQGLSSAGVRPNHSFMSLNACNPTDLQSALDVLRQLRLNNPLVIVHEGVLMYFDRQEQRLFRDHMRQLMDVGNGIWITPDFSERETDANLVQKLLNLRLSRQVGRRFNRFECDESVLEFLAEGGLVGTKLPFPSDNPMNASEAETAEHSRAWVVRRG